MNAPKRIQPHQGLQGNKMSEGPQLPFGFASSHGVLLLNGSLVLHLPGIRLETVQELRRYLGRSFSLREVSERDFRTQLTTTYQRQNGEAQRVADDMGADDDLARLADQIPENSDLMAGEDDAPVIRLINAILSQAVREKASDIHIEPFEDRLAVRFRVDGVLNEVLSPGTVLAPLLVSRIKVMAKLDIAEKRLPQDGRISVKLAGHAVDIRVSTIPSAHGERVVLRLLDKQAGQLMLEQLDMPPSVLEGFKRAVAKPHGIILVTGPTGSGKTTTLYAGLTELNDASQNILTIEDPVEYLLPGVGQTQVNSKIGMTFARGLRAILRQDPDIVMVGEIRDGETADIAVQASLTGHLVLSTLHTNTAVGAITRLQDMGVEPFLLSSGLVAVMAQRLLRKLCLECRQPYAADESLQQRLAIDEAATLYHPGGCDNCNNTGYRGRAGIFELIEIDSQVAALIHEKASEQDILQLVRQRTPSIEESAKQLVLAGDTSLEEALRVTAGTL